MVKANEMVKKQVKRSKSTRNGQAHAVWRRASGCSPRGPRLSAPWRAAAVFELKWLFLLDFSRLHDGLRKIYLLLKAPRFDPHRRLSAPWRLSGASPRRKPRGPGPASWPSTSESIRVSPSHSRYPRRATRRASHSESGRRRSRGVPWRKLQLGQLGMRIPPGQPGPA
jgi:hypothetical protein